MGIVLVDGNVGLDVFDMSELLPAKLRVHTAAPTEV